MRLLTLIAFTCLALTVQAGVVADSLPAERERGLVWSSSFRSQAEVEALGCTVTGSPTFSAVDGVTLDGISQFLMCNVAPFIFDTDKWAVVLKFNPNFNWDTDIVAYFFDAEEAGGANRFYIVKSNSASSYVLQISIGGSLIASIPTADYKDYWRENRDNILVVTSTTGDTDAWLNGNLILDNDPSGWSKRSDIINFYIGRRVTNFGFFPGIISSIKVFHNKLTDQEAIDYASNGAFAYRNNAIADFPMRAVDHDPTKSRVKDFSGNGRHGTFGGAPIKLATVGYEFDGVDDVILGNTENITTAGYTIETYAKWDVASLKTIASIGIIGSGDTDVIGTGVQGGVGTNNQINFGHWTTSWQVCSTGVVPELNRYYHIVGTNDGTNTRIYLDGVLMNTCNGSPITVAQGLHIARRHDDANKNFFDGIIKYVVVHSRVLTPLQVFDAFVNARLRFNSR